MTWKSLSLVNLRCHSTLLAARPGAKRGRPQRPAQIDRHTGHPGTGVATRLLAGQGNCPWFGNGRLFLGHVSLSFISISECRRSGSQTNLCRVHQQAPYLVQSFHRQSSIDPPGLEKAERLCHSRAADQFESGKSIALWFPSDIRVCECNLTSPPRPKAGRKH